MDVAVSVRNFVKNYSKNKVVKDISFDVYKGEAFALLGVDGVGKTTILECIEGLREYNSGDIIVNGTIGVQLQSAALPKNIRPMEALKLFSKCNNSLLNEELITAFNIPDLKNKQYDKMSTSQKRCLHLALALTNDPDIVFLDEPTAGLDPEGRVCLHNEIRKLKSSGKTIIMASHDMAEVACLCDKIAMLKDGKIAFIGTANDLENEMGRFSTIYVKTLNPLKIIGLSHSTFKYSDKDYSLFMTENIGEALYELINVIKKSSNIIIDVKVEKSTLEERFMDIAKGKRNG